MAVVVAASFAWWWWHGRPVTLVDAPGGRFPCLSYAPYRDSQTPYQTDLVIPRTQIEADLRLLANHTSCIRTYETGHGLAEVVPIAASLGMKVMLGAWVGDKADENIRELADVVLIANRYPETVKAIIVGNEVLLRGEYSPDGLKRVIDSVRAQTTAPITYADLWSVWDKYPEMADAVDFLTIHTLHYWDNSTKPVQEAASDSLRIAQRLATAHPGKPIFIGEAGWPSAGRMRQEALPSLLNEARYVRQLIVDADKAGTGLNIIEAFDQPWKRRPEGTVGGFWGVFDNDRQAKFPLSGPVRADPNWLLHFAISASLGSLMVLSGVVFASKRRLSVLGGLVLSCIGQIAGIGLVLAVLQSWDASYNVFSFVVWSGRWLIAFATAALFPWALARLLEGQQVRPTSMIELATRWKRKQYFKRVNISMLLGLARGLTLFTAASTMLSFIFDGRHRDFPIASYAILAVIFLCLAVFARLVPSVKGPTGDDTSFDDLGEERFLALVLVMGSIVSPLIEGVGNWQALIWATVCLALAIGVHLDYRTRRPEEESGRTSLRAAISNAAPDNSGP